MLMDRKQGLQIFFIVMAVVLTLLFISLVIYSFSIFLLIFAGILVAIFFSNISDYLNEKTFLPRAVALTITVISILGVIIGIGFIAGPQIANQLDLLFERIPEALDTFEETLQQYDWGKRLLEQTAPGQQWISRSTEIIGEVTGVFSTTLGFALNTLLVLVLGVYLASNPAVYIRGVYYLVPKSKQERMKDVVQALGRAIHWWLLGRLSMMIIVGFMTATGLYILNVPLALSLGFLAFLFSFVPVIGPIASAIPAILIGWLQGTTTALYVILLYIIVQSLESYLITPNIQRRAVFIPPAILIFAQVLMAFLAGLLGVFLATPLSVVVVVLIQMLYVEDVLGYEVKLLGEH